MTGKQVVLLQFTLLLVASAFAAPLVWMVLGSLKPGEQLIASPTSLLPTEWKWENFSEAISAMPFARYLLNTLILCLGCTCGTVISCTLAAYAFAKLKWRGRDAFFAILIATLLLPWHSTLIPRFFLLREAGLTQTHWGLIVPCWFGDAFSIFLLRQFFLSIPEELSQAARMDGCSEMGIVWRVIVPLARPAIYTVATLQFINVWNDFQGPLLLLSDPEKFPLSYGLERFVGAHSSQTHLLLAAAIVFALPSMGLFLIAQRRFLSTNVTSGLKG